jgi:hypothetical protein
MGRARGMAICNINVTTSASAADWYSSKPDRCSTRVASRTIASVISISYSEFKSRTFRFRGDSTTGLSCDRHSTPRLAFVIYIIANLFAHDKHYLTFDSTEVSGLCDQLKWIEKFPWGGTVGEKPTSPRNRYIATIMHLYSFLAVGVGKPIRYSEGPFSELYA